MKISIWNIFVALLFIIALFTLQGCANTVVKDSSGVPQYARSVINKLIDVYPKDSLTKHTKLHWTKAHFTASAYGHFKTKRVFIEFGPSLLKIAKNEDELAMIFAHELSHIHLSHSLLSNPKTKEREADILAGRIVKKAGYDCKKAANFWMRFYEYNIGAGYNKNGVWYDPHKKRRDNSLKSCLQEN